MFEDLHLYHLITFISVIFNWDVLVLSIRFSIAISGCCSSELSFSISVGSSKGERELDTFDYFNKLLGLRDMFSGYLCHC